MSQATTAAFPLRRHVKPGVGPGTRGFLCTACLRELDKLETVGVYRDGADERFSVCEECIAAGVDHITRCLTQTAAERRSDAERLRRRAAALRTDPTLGEDADAEKSLADLRDDEADWFDREAAAEWHLPTVADLRALERELYGDLEPDPPALRVLTLEEPF